MGPGGLLSERSSIEDDRRMQNVNREGRSIALKRSRDWAEEEALRDTHLSREERRGEDHATHPVKRSAHHYAQDANVLSLQQHSNSTRRSSNTTVSSTFILLPASSAASSTTIRDCTSWITSEIGYGMRMLLAKVARRT